MSRLSYSEKLKDPRWQRKRLEILDRDNFQCQQCGSTSKTLHVDHGIYDGREPWDYPSETLKAYCEDCHKELHRLRDLLKEALATASHADVEFVLGALAARLGTGQHPESYEWAGGYGSTVLGADIDTGAYALQKLGVWPAAESFTGYLMESVAPDTPRIRALFFQFQDR